MACHTFDAEERCTICKRKKLNPSGGGGTWKKTGRPRGRPKSNKPKKAKKAKRPRGRPKSRLPKPKKLVRKRCAEKTPPRKCFFEWHGTKKKKGDPWTWRQICAHCRYGPLH